MHWTLFGVGFHVHYGSNCNWDILQQHPQISIAVLCWLKFLSMPIWGNYFSLNESFPSLKNFLQALIHKNLTEIQIVSETALNGDKTAPVASHINFLNGNFTNTGFLGLVGQSGFTGNSLVLCEGLTHARNLRHLTISARLKRMDAESITQSLQNSQC